MNKFLLSSCLVALVGCAAPVAKPGFQQGSNTYRSGFRNLAAIATTNFLISPSIAHGPVRPVSFVALSVCDAAAAVLGHGLGANYACVPGSGSVSMYFPKGSGGELLDAFNRAVEAAGGSVVVSEGLVTVTGGEGDVAAARGSGGDMFGADDGEDAVAVVVAPPNDLLEVIGAAGRAYPSLIVERAPPGAIADELNAAASDMGANLRAYTTQGAVWVAYTQSQQTQAILGMSAASQADSMLLPVDEPDQAVIDSLLIDFPSMTANFTSRGLALVGPTDDLRRFVAVAGDLLAYRRDYRISGAFLSWSGSSSRSVGLDVSGSVALGDSVALGFAQSGANLALLVDGLVANGSASVVSRPSLVVSAGSRGTFTSGSQVPVVSSITEDGVTSQNVEYRDTGIALDVVPTSLSDGIRLEITLTVSSVADSSGTNGLPIFNRQSYTGSVVVQLGQVLVISGLTDQTQDVRNGIGLSSITRRARTDRELQILLSVF